MNLNSKFKESESMIRFSIFWMCLFAWIFLSAKSICLVLCRYWVVFEPIYGPCIWDSTISYQLPKFQVKKKSTNICQVTFTGTIFILLATFRQYRNLSTFRSKSLQFFLFRIEPQVRIRLFWNLRFGWFLWWDFGH